MERTTVSRRYRVDRRIGDGGMAEVYLGHDLLLNRPVAIKALRAQYASTPGFRTRFEREAQAVAGFTHPNIIDIYDVGEERGTPYIVMEYVRGQTLKTIIEEEGPFAPDDVAALLEQVCAALDYAHAQGIVHRDVKPQNILVDDDGLAKVVDFGIAKGLADSHLTEAGTGIGTVHYISPEQASGLMATPESDIYSVGVVAFEMLTGCLPFDADSSVGVAMRHVRDDPPRPSSLEPSVTGAVDAIVLRALAKDPTRRYPSAGAFAAAMTDWRAYRADGPATRRGTVPRPTESTVAVPVGAAGPLDEPMASGDADPAGDFGLPRAAEVRSGPRPRQGSGAIAPPAVAGRPVVTATDPRRDDVGCGTWAAGLAVLIALVALIWVGAQFSSADGLSIFGGEDDPAATEEVAPTQPAAASGAAPEDAAAPTPTAIPSATPTPPPDTALLVEVPDLRGLSLEQAIDRATARGFQLEQSDRVYDAGIEVDAVADQDPPAGASLPQGEKVVVKLSNGSPEVDLAALNLVNQTPEEAREMLSERGLGVAEEARASSEVAAGLVVGHSPERSALVGDTVTLFVSQGDAVELSAALLSQPVAAVRSRLEADGLRVVEAIPVSRADAEALGVDLDAEGIASLDVVGVRDGDGAVDFGTWVPRGSEVTLVYYDVDRDDA